MRTASALLAGVILGTLISFHTPKWPLALTEPRISSQIRGTIIATDQTQRLLTISVDPADGGQRMRTTVLEDAEWYRLVFERNVETITRIKLQPASATDALPGTRIWLVSPSASKREILASRIILIPHYE